MLTRAATLEAEIITNWAAQVPEDLTSYQTIGHDWNRRYMWETYPVPRTASADTGSSDTGSANDHICIAATPGDFPRPTANDVVEVRAKRVGGDTKRLFIATRTITLSLRVVI